MSTKPKLNVPVHIKQRQAFWTGLVISTRIITDIQRRKDIVKLTLINMTRVLDIIRFCSCYNRLNNWVVQLSNKMQ